MILVISWLQTIDTDFLARATHVGCRHRKMLRNLFDRSKNTMKAIWNGTVIAESDDTEVVEGNHYFPAAAINKEYFAESDTTSVCPWKGTANYYSVVVGEETNRDAAWYYVSPKPEAKNIEGHIAFWKGVEVTD